MNPAQPDPPATTYVYDPSGVTTANGETNYYPFLYHGMEQEAYYDPIYYSGGGQFYEPQIMRGLSMIGALGRESPAGGGGGVGAAAGAGAAVSGGFNAASIAEAVAFRDPTAAEQSDAPNGSGGGILIVAWFEQFFNDMSNLFGGGGGSNPPPNYYVFQHRAHRPHGGRHPLYDNILGIPEDLVPSQNTLVLASATPAPIAPLRRPDFYTFEVNIGGVFGGSVDLTVDRYGRYYVGIGPEVGKSLTIVSVSLTAGCCSARRPRRADCMGS